MFTAELLYFDNVFLGPPGTFKSLEHTCVFCFLLTIVSGKKKKIEKRKAHITIPIKEAAKEFGGVE